MMRFPQACFTIREKRTKPGAAIRALLDRLDSALRAGGYIAMSGRIIDASLIAAPRQGDTREEIGMIKTGRVPDYWKNKPAQLRHKDRAARGTMKFATAKTREDETAPAVDIAIPTFGYRTMCRSIAVLA